MYLSRNKRPLYSCHFCLYLFFHSIYSFAHPYISFLSLPWPMCLNNEHEDCQELHPKFDFEGNIRKLMGFVVSSHGIEVDPDKIKAIKNLHVPRTQKKVRGFLGRLNYISQFISHLTDKCDLTLKLLKK